jgi:hypothetical protein
MVTIQIRVPASRAAFAALLEALIAIDRLWLRSQASTVGALRRSIYDRGVRYKREERDPETGVRREDWLTYPEIIGNRGGDCEDLAAARVAELREQGVNARPWLSRHGRTWHVRVMLPNGQLEDPSARLGMRGGPTS